MAGFKTSGSAPLAEINVTPLVDVMLVLLIVFMISAPLMQQGVKIDLPKANTGSMNATPDQLVLSIDQDHKIYLGERVVRTGTLLEKLTALVKSKPQIEIVIQADQTLEYGWVTQVIAEVKKSGIEKVGLATSPGDRQFKL